jgi:hypothetical protein
MPRITKVNISNFVIKEGEVSLEMKTFDFKKINIKHRIEEYKKYLNDHHGGIDNKSIHKDFGIPLPITKFCKFIGTIRGSYKYYSKKNRGNYDPRFELNDLIEKFYDHNELVTEEGALKQKRKVYPGDFKYSS